MTRYRAKTNENQHFLTSQFWVIKCTHFSSDYKDIQRTAKINVPKGTEIGSHTSLASQRLQECAKICVKKCKRVRNWKIDFADVCIFFFEGSHICRCLPILRPPNVPRSHFSYPKTKASTLIISHLYLQILHSASESRFCVGK